MSKISRARVELELLTAIDDGDFPIEYKLCWNKAVSKHGVKWWIHRSNSTLHDRSSPPATSNPSGSTKRAVSSFPVTVSNATVPATHISNTKHPPHLNQKATHLALASQTTNPQPTPTMFMSTPPSFPRRVQRTKILRKQKKKNSTSPLKRPLSPVVWVARSPPRKQLQALIRGMYTDPIISKPQALSRATHPSNPLTPFPPEAP